ncbi:MAG: hypothetical protein M3256_18730 [Actinomycetota bacterium]|nr:hypothetical protein [Actinomycetota bacterium]
MSDDELYEDDEPIEDVRTAWNEGEKGTTSGPRDLNERARSIVDRAVARFEERQEVRLRVVSSGTAATTLVQDSGSGASVVDRVEDEPVTASAYRVG